MSTSSMRALVVERPEHYGLQEVRRPKPGPGEVLLRVGHCGICGTDLHIISGQFPIPRFPLVIGHEFAGEIVALGDNVSDLELGRLVAADTIKACGTCHQCHRGSIALCENASELGIHEPGGLAEYAVAPARNVHPLPPGVTSKAGALVEPLACAIHGQERVRVEMGDTVVVIGAGVQGLLHLTLARLRGARLVIVCARQKRRKDRALALGADLVVDGESGDPVAQIRAATDGRGADVVIEASGSPRGYANAVLVTRRGGRLLVYGVAPPDARFPATAYEIFDRELTIVGSFGGPGHDWPRAIALIDSRRIDPTELIDTERPLDQAPTLIRDLATDRSLLKGVVRMTEAAPLS